MYWQDMILRHICMVKPLQTHQTKGSQTCERFEKTSTLSTLEKNTHVFVTFLQFSFKIENNNKTKQKTKILVPILKPLSHPVKAGLSLRSLRQH